MSVRSHQCKNEIRPGTVAACDRPQNHGRPIVTQRMPSAFGRSSISPKMQEFWTTGDPEALREGPAPALPNPFGDDE